MNCDSKTMRLYAVTDRAWTGRQTLYEQVEDALRGGAGGNDGSGGVRCGVYDGNADAD